MADITVQSFIDTFMAAANVAAARTALGLGSMAVQEANSVLISGGTISGMTAVSGTQVFATTHNHVNSQTYLFDSSFVPPGGLYLRSTGYVNWAPDSNAVQNGDTTLSRGGVATLNLGILHATTPTNQTFKAHNVTTGTGAALTLAGGTGSVAGGAVILATSATTGAPAPVLTVKASGIVNIANLPTSSAGLATGDLYTSAGALMVA